jgi:hypothetical protein
LSSARDLALAKEGKYYNWPTFLSHSISLTSLHSTVAASPPRTHRRHRARPPRTAAAAALRLPAPAPGTNTTPATSAPAITTIAPTPVNTCFILNLDWNDYSGNVMVDMFSKYMFSKFVLMRKYMFSKFVM